MGRNMELSHLTEEEQQHILEVVQRDFKLQEKERERIDDLEGEVKNELSKCEILSQSDFNHNYCIHCYTRFFFLLRPRFKCEDCSYDVCKNCLTKTVKGESQTTLCLVCNKNRKYQKQACHWFYGENKQSKWRQFGSVKVADSLRSHINDGNEDSGSENGLASPMGTLMRPTELERAGDRHLITKDTSINTDTESMYSEVVSIGVQVSPDFPNGKLFSEINQEQVQQDMQQLEKRLQQEEQVGLQTERETVTKVQMVTSTALKVLSCAEDVIAAERENLAENAPESSLEARLLALDADQDGGETFFQPIVDDTMQKNSISYDQSYNLSDTTTDLGDSPNIIVEELIGSEDQMLVSSALRGDLEASQSESDSSHSDDSVIEGSQSREGHEGKYNRSAGMWMVQEQMAVGVVQEDIPGGFQREEDFTDLGQQQDEISIRVISPNPSGYDSGDERGRLDEDYPAASIQDSLVAGSDSEREQVHSANLLEEAASIEEKVYMSAGVVYSMEDQLDQLEQQVKLITADSNEVEVSSLENRMALAMAQVSRSDLELKSVEQRVEELNQASHGTIGAIVITPPYGRVRSASSLEDDDRKGDKRPPVSPENLSSPERERSPFHRGTRLMSSNRWSDDERWKPADHKSEDTASADNNNQDRSPVEKDSHSESFRSQPLGDRGSHVGPSRTEKLLSGKKLSRKLQIHTSLV